MKFIFETPLTQVDVDKANQSPPFFGTAKADSNPIDSIYGRRYSRTESWQLLQAWFNKKFDWKKAGKNSSHSGRNLHYCISASRR